MHPRKMNFELQDSRSNEENTNVSYANSIGHFIGMNKDFFISLVYIKRYRIIFKGNLMISFFPDPGTTK